MCFTVLTSLCPACREIMSSFPDGEKSVPLADLGDIRFWVCQKCAARTLTTEEILRVGYQRGFSDASRAYSEATSKIESALGRDYLEPRFDSPDVAWSAAGDVAWSDDPQEKTAFDVFIESAGPNKLEAIKAVRQAIRGIGLFEAKKVVEGAPTLLAEGVSLVEAEGMKTMIEKSGAAARIE